MAAPFTLEQFTGVNNQTSADAMVPADLAACVNFDVNDAGALESRPGLASVWTGTDAHSLHGHDGALFFRAADKLYRLAGGTAAVVDTGLDGATCFASAPQGLFYSDGQRCRVYAGGAAAPWGLPPPSFSVSGAPGTSLVTAVYLRDGMESGAATPAAAGDTAVVDIPAHPEATHKVVYLSKPGGTVLYRAAVVPVGHGPVTVNASMATGPALETLHKTPPPGHEVSAVWNGRALVGAGRFLLYSDPFRFDLFDPLRQAVPFPSDVTLLVAVSPQALIVGTDSAIYRLTGADIGAASISQIADFGAVRGAGVRVDASVFPDAGQSVGVVFAAHGGFCFAGADGGVANLSGARFRPGRFISGSAAFSRKPGNHSVVFTIRK